MEAYDFVHLSLFAFGDVKDMDVVQPRSYFLARLMALDFGFVSGFYGPHSSQIEDGVSRLRGIGFTHEQYVHHTGKTSLKLTHDGEHVAGRKATGKEWNALEKTVAVLKSVGSLSVETLQVASKLYHQGYGTLSMKEMYGVVGDFGWRVPEAQTRSAAKFLSKLELMMVTK